MCDSRPISTADSTPNSMRAMRCGAFASAMNSFITCANCCEDALAAGGGGDEEEEDEELLEAWGGCAKGRGQGWVGWYTMSGGEREGRSGGRAQAEEEK